MQNTIYTVFLWTKRNTAENIAKGIAIEYPSNQLNIELKRAITPRIYTNGG